MAISADELVDFLSQPTPRTISDDFRRRVEKALFGMPAQLLLIILGAPLLLVVVVMAGLALQNPDASARILRVAVMLVPLAFAQVFLFRWILARPFKHLLPNGVFTVGRIIKLTVVKGNYAARIAYEWDGKEVTSNDVIRARWHETAKQCLETGRYVGILVDPRNPRRVMIPGKLLGKEEAYAFTLTDDAGTETQPDLSAPADGRETEETSPAQTSTAAP